ncbi:MAG: hypothetical protein RBG13Loki_2517 [Promethearchaeota archaeon CR_4]|nr:MAG: hypothetical protein RBG13Loki_2517 [Candidatus Lokiarchaeota archaeon CR_4]
MQEIINDWADLNQYIGRMQVTILGDFLKSGITSDNMTEQEVYNHINILLTRVTNDIDKIIFALLGMRRIFFIGEDRKLGEHVLSALFAYYPHPSVGPWIEDSSNCLVVGTHPNLI